MNLIAKVSWLQKMCNYLYSRLGGTVRTVNGTAPDANGNVVVSGSAGTLQTVTDGAGNNITSNALQVTGLDNFDPSTVGTIYAFVPGANYSIIQNAASTYSSSIQLINGGVTFSVGNGSNNSTNTAVSFYSDFSAQSVIAEFTGTVRGVAAVNNDEFVTLGQMPQMVGGVHTFNSDGLTDNFTIPHGLTTVTSHFVTRNSDPNGNLIATQISGSNIVVTFVAGAPLVGLTIIVNWGAFGSI